MGAYSFGSEVHAIERGSELILLALRFFAFTLFILLLLLPFLVFLLLLLLDILLLNIYILFLRLLPATLRP